MLGPFGNRKTQLKVPGMEVSGETSGWSWEGVAFEACVLSTHVDTPNCPGKVLQRFPFFRAGNQKMSLTFRTFCGVCMQVQMN